MQKPRTEYSPVLPKLKTVISLATGNVSTKITVFKGYLFSVQLVI